jgi:hypothetical protein
MPPRKAKLSDIPENPPPISDGSKAMANYWEEPKPTKGFSRSDFIEKRKVRCLLKIGILAKYS